MKNNLFKKSMSVFLSVLMLLTCWVWVAPTEAEAVSGTVYGVPAVNGSHYNAGTTNAYGTPVFNGNTDRWFLWQNGDDWTKVFYPSHIYLDKTESLEGAGYYWNIQWHFGNNTDYRTFLGANIWGDHSQWTGKPERYYTMNNIFSNYAVDASLPAGAGTGVYSGDSNNHDLRIVGYGYSSQGSDRFTYNQVTHNKYVCFRSNQSTNNATLYLKGNPAESYVGTTSEYNTSGDSFQGYGYAQKWGSSWSTHAGGSNVYYNKGDDSSYYEGEWIEMAWNVTIYDKSSLNSTITSAESTYTNSAKYTAASWSAYQTALANAKTVLKTRETTQSNINTAKTNLENAINALVVNTYTITFDNLFDFNAFTIGGNLTVNERTNTGFTVTSTAADGNTGFSAAIPVVPGKTYIFSADTSIEAVSGGYDMYIHTLDANQAGETTATPDTSNGAHREGSVYISLTGQTTNKTPYIKFTAGSNTRYIKIRFDANAVGNKLTVNNIRVYEDGTVANGVSYINSKTYTYGDSYGTLPIPTRTGYTFNGWVDANGNAPSGNVTAGKTLYSTWTVNAFTVNFVNAAGTTVSTKTYNYGTPASSIEKPANTASRYDGSKHYSYSWPTISDVTGDVTYKEDETGTAHTYNQQVATDTYKAKDATCTSKATYYYSCSCGAKGTTTFEHGNLAPHVLEHTPAVSASCTSEGTYEHWYCTKCSTNFADENATQVMDNILEPKKAHTEETIPAVAPTCTTPGKTEGKKCSVCDEILVAQTDVAALGHLDANKDHICDRGCGVAQGTCADGNSDHKCDYGCSKTFGEHKDSDNDGDHKCDYCGVDGLTSHIKGAETREDVTDATCDAAGKYDSVYYCTECKIEMERTNDVTIEKLPHAWNEATYTWTDDGKSCTATRTCKNFAKHVETETVSATGEEKTASTCTVMGTTTYTAKFTVDWATAQTKDVQDIAVIAHTPAEAVQENYKDSTCYAEGSYDEVVYCSACGEKLSTTPKTIEKIAHTPGEAVRENEVSATCYAVGSYDEVVYCSVEACKAKISSTPKTIEKIAHSPAEAVEEDRVEATCYAEGSYNEVVYCSVEACKAKISSTPKTIEKIAHTPAEAVKEDIVAATCYAEGSYNEVVYCSVEECKEKLSSTPKTIEKLDHTPAAAVRENEVPATCYAEGSYNEVVYCSVEACKAKISSTPKTIEKIAHTPAEAVEEDRVEATCYAEGSYNEVVYCSVEACKAKISSTPKTIEKIAHTPAAAVIENNVAPDCENPGSYDEVVYCSVEECKHQISRETITVDKLGHKEVTDEAVAATCTETGLTEGKHCSVCDKVLVAQEVVPANGHSWDEGVIDPEPTCNDAGVKTFTCGTCGKTKTEAVVAKGHTEGEAVIENEVDPDCVNDGSYDTVVYCTVCDAELSRGTVIVKANGHTEGEAVIENNVAPDCDTDGSYDTVVYCTVCDEELSRNTTVVGALGHKEGEAVIENEVAADCDTDGSYDTVVYCTVCDAELSRETTVVGALGHTEGEAVIENKVDPDCVNKGSYDTVVYCTVCDEQLSRETTVVDALGHKYEAVETAPTCTEAGYTTYTCSVCGDSYTDNEVAALGHTEGKAVIENKKDATCVSPYTYDEVVYCTVCDAELSRRTITEGVVSGHTEEIIKGTPATCISDGTSDGKKCSVCGEILVAQEVLPATGHNMGKTPYKTTSATCKTPRTEYYKCKNCDFTETKTFGEATGPHTILVAEQVPATCENKGYTVYWCSECSTNVQIKLTEALGHTDEDHDGVCDVFGCGGTVEVPGAEKACTCVCHKEGFLNELIYKILRFFWKLFGIGKSCDCGTVHY